jgi:hypothetical protein
MYTIISVVFTETKLSDEQIAEKRSYAFVCNDPVEIGDLITGSTDKEYSPMQVIEKYQSDSPFIYNIDGKRVQLKTLHIKTYSKSKKEEPKKLETNLKIKEMKKNSMFTGIAEKFRSQYSPELENEVRMSSDGVICVAVGSEYIGMSIDGVLTSYPDAMLIKFPVYSINKPSDQVKVGEIIKTGNEYGRVMGRNANGSFKIQSFTGYTHDKQEIRDFLLGQSITRVLINVYHFEDSGFNPVLFALGDEENNFGVEDLLMLSMTEGGKELLSKTGVNPLMLMMFASKGDQNPNSSDIASLMLKTQ